MTTTPTITWSTPHHSVSPPLAAALARANVPDLMTFNARELRALEAA